VDGVSVEVFREAAVVACSLIVLGGVSIAVACFGFSVFSPCACFGGIVVHCAVTAFVHLMSISLSSCSFGTLAAILSARTATPISPTGILSHSGECISDFFGYCRSLSILADCIHTPLRRGGDDSLFNDLNGHSI
jgi:hypothetical protein